MKIKALFFLLMIILTCCNSPKRDNQSYQIIRKSNELPGNIDNEQISKLNKPLKALTAYYAALAGSYCGDDECDLTSALGLGKQGSKTHRNLIKMYLPSDEIAEKLLNRQCSLPKSGSSAFSEFRYLTIVDLGKTIEVDYEICYDDHGETNCSKWKDVFLFSNDKFQRLE